MSINFSSRARTSLFRIREKKKEAHTEDLYYHKIDTTRSYTTPNYPPKPCVYIHAIQFFRLYSVTGGIQKYPRRPGSHQTLSHDIHRKPDKNDRFPTRVSASRKIRRIFLVGWTLENVTYRPCNECHCNGRGWGRFDGPRMRESKGTLIIRSTAS